jgi:hypothetical protein
MQENGEKIAIFRLEDAAEPTTPTHATLSLEHNNQT